MNKEVRTYISNHCANFDSNGMCHLGTAANGSRMCPFFFPMGKRCTYAETSVIPGDARIEALYMAGKESAEELHLCSECNVPITKASNATKYCASCVISVRRRRQRKYLADKRIDFYDKGE